MKIPEIKLSRREKILFILCVVAVLAFLFINSVFSPLLSRWNFLEREINHKELLLTKGRRAIEREDVITSEYERVKDQMISERSMEEEISTFLSEIENLSGKNIRITNIKPRSVEEDDFSQSLFVELDVEGEIGPLTKFLYDIYESQMLIEVDQVDLSAKAREGNVLRGHMVISRVLLRLKS